MQVVIKYRHKAAATFIVWKRKFPEGYIPSTRAGVFLVVVVFVVVFVCSTPLLPYLVEVSCESKRSRRNPGADLFVGLNHLYVFCVLEGVFLVSWQAVFCVHVLLEGVLSVSAGVFYR